MMPSIGITADWRVVAARLDTGGARVGVAVFEVTARAGLILQGRVKAHAAGRPGPRIVTGDYNRSIGLIVGSPGGNPTAWVGTNAPQGRRLELGFVGADALGRHYSQAPLPHFRPAIDSIADEYVASVAAAISVL